MGFITDTSSDAKGLAAFRQFSFPFWLVNVLELLERGAFYSVAAVLSVYMLNVLEFSGTQTGLVFSVLFPLLFFLPVVAAAFADKYGFRATLAASFVLLASGYAALLFLESFWGVLAAVVIFGAGAGVFKPVVAAVVAQTTTPEQRNFGYAIYYWIINLGAFLIPLGFAFYFGLGPLRDDIAAQARISLMAASGFMAANLVATLLLYRNIRAPQPGKSILQALKDIAPPFKDVRFLVLLLIYSGFWFMYAMNQTFLPAYVEGYFIATGLAPVWFTVFALGTINPGTIITAGPVLGKLTERVPSLLAIVLGVAIYVVGFAALGFTTNFWIVFGAIVLYSVGEFIVHPNFLSYVSKIAPTDRISVYMGVAFVPIGLGYTVGSSAGGVLYDMVLASTITPSVFWAVVSSVGLLTIGALLAYNRFMERREQVIPAPVPSASRRLFTGPAAAALAVLLVPALVGGAMFAGTSPQGAPLEAQAVELEEVTETLMEATSREGDAVMHDFELVDPVRNVTLVLTWTDEAASTPGATNAPDTLRLRLRVPGGSMLDAGEAANPQGGEGEVRFTVPAGHVAGGAYAAEVTVVEAGEVTAGPVVVSEDDGNAWTLTLEYEGEAPAGRDAAGGHAEHTAAVVSLPRA